MRAAQSLIGSVQATPIFSHEPPPSLKELSSFEIRFQKGTGSESECRSWLARMIAAYRDLLPGGGERDTEEASQARGNG